MKKTALALFLLFVWNAFAWADVPKYISFQGELTDSQGTRISTSKNVTFQIWTAATGGSSLWSEGPTAITPANGIVSRSLGQSSSINLAFDTGYWLGVTVSPDAEMTPRVRLTTSPYAFIAKYLDTGAAAYGALSVAETVTASKFVGDGSLLTGITASGAADTDWTIVAGDTIYHLTGNVGIGTTDPVLKLRVVQDDASNNAVSRVLRLDHTTSGTASNGIGVGIELNAERSDGGLSGAAMIEGILTDVTAGTPKGSLVFKTNNAESFQERMRVDYLGNVGIGSTAPGAKLDVVGSVLVSDSMAVGDTRLVVLKSGNVGIGTSSPSTALQVNGTVTATAFSGSGAGLTGIAGSPDTDWTMTAGDIYRASGKVGIGTAAPSDSLHVAGTVRVSDSMTVRDTVFVVNSTSGNVGIGTASPNVKLSLGTDIVGQKFALYDGVGNFFGLGVESARMVFHTNNAERMTLNSTGGLGIGTTSPGARLQVVGADALNTSLAASFGGSSETGLVVTNAAKVGIGTAVPTERLDVEGGFSLLNSQVSTTNRNYGPVLWSDKSFGMELGYDAGVWSTRIFTRNASEAITFGRMPTTATLHSDFVEWARIVNGNVGIGDTAPGDSLVVKGGVISDTLTVGDTFLVVKKSGNVGIGSVSPGAKLDVVGSVLVSDSMVVGDTRLVVLKSGNVGIGTASPNSKLEVNDASALEFRLMHAANGAVVLRRDGAVGYILTESGIGSNRNLAFGMEPVTGGAVTEWARFDPNGNLGISTTAPGDSLHVNGTLRVEDTMVVGDTWLVVTKSGNVGIGTASPGAKLHVAGDVIVKDTMTVGDTFLVVLASGRVGIGTASPDTDFSVNGGASKVGGGSWATFSDGRLKNIDGEFKAGTAELMKLNPVKYRYRADNPVGIRDGAPHIGLVAQEVKEAIPEAVQANNQGYLMLDNDPVIFAMLNAIKEQKAQNDKLTSVVQDQQAQIETLTKKMEAMEAGR